MLSFRDLEEALRRLLWSRVQSGELTGMALAEKTGFRKAHISHFLNRKRGFSIEAMDRVLQVEKLSVLDLIPSEEMNSKTSILAPREDQYENIPVVASQNALAARIEFQDVIDIVKFKRALLRRVRPDMSGDRSGWQRFVIIKPTRADCEAMKPRLGMSGCTVLIDRHYNSLVPYRRGEPNMYAVRDGKEVVVRTVAVENEKLLLRPENRRAELKTVALPTEASPAALVLGRIAHVCMET